MTEQDRDFEIPVETPIHDWDRRFHSKFYRQILVDRGITLEELAIEMGWNTPHGRQRVLPLFNGMRCSGQGCGKLGCGKPHWKIRRGPSTWGVLADLDAAITRITERRADLAWMEDQEIRLAAAIDRRHRQTRDLMAVS